MVYLFVFKDICFSCIHLKKMGAEIGARAISHLECVSDDGIRAMANAKTSAVVLPHTGYLLRIEMPPVRRMIDAGVPVALGTDANPNAFSSAMVFNFVYCEI